MKPEHRYAALAAAMVLAFGTVEAQRAPRTDDADDFSQAVSYAAYLKGADLRASEIVGARVRNAAGENLGEIEELVIPTGNQDDMLVVVSVGGVLDVGDKLVALPYKELRVSPDGDTFYFDRTEEQLEAAPAFSHDAQAERQARADRAAEVDRPAVERPAQVERQARAAQSERDTRARAAAPARTAPTADRPRTAAPTANAAKSANVELDVFDYRASDLIGATVLDDRGERVAKVDDIVVSTEDDKLHAVLAIGGFAGFGAKLISIPFDDLQITSADANPQVRIKMTGEQLEQLAESRAPFRYERQVAKAPGDAPRG
jgi:sporulation protein YlmC with PRC-barrel domain